MPSTSSAAIADVCRRLRNYRPGGWLGLWRTPDWAALLTEAAQVIEDLQAEIESLRAAAIPLAGLRENLAERTHELEQAHDGIEMLRRHLAHMRRRMLLALDIPVCGNVECDRIIADTESYLCERHADECNRSVTC